MRNQIILQDGSTGEWLTFENPQEIIRVHNKADLKAELKYIEQQVNQHNLYAAGFLTYEAAGAFDAALHTHPPTELPLLWFGLYAAPKHNATLPVSDTADYNIGTWQANITEQAYTAQIAQIKHHIAAGDTYQVNFTQRLQTTFTGSAKQLFIDLNQAQRGRYGAFIDGDEWVICSASPELFFTLDGNCLVSKPMKGTAARGLTLNDDVAQMQWLQQSEKNRAENVMIVDMIRNDFGRIAQFGSVHVPALFTIERYPTVLQMTSTVTAQTDASIADIIAALFPCASITGAPKVRSMEIIAALEQAPRGIYTGAIGFIAPNRKAQFNVAIRTVLVDKVEDSAEYGTGGGIVWDSATDAEYAECFLKAKVLTTQPPQFSLLESLLWEPDTGYYLLDLHLARLQASATYFKVVIDEAAIRQALSSESDELIEPSKVRLIVSLNGAITVESASAGTLPAHPKLGFADAPIHSNNPYLYHKTTHRSMYTRAKASRPDCDDVILYNERGEVTEATSSNLIFELDGMRVTPPVSSGILAGTQRAQLLTDGKVCEQVVTLNDAKRAKRIWLINSVRRWREAWLSPETNNTPCHAETPLNMTT